MRILLAPMEGVVDHLMRQMLTEIGGFDLCITEFLRVVDRVHPRHSFIKLCPELLNQGRTASGIPVRLQLLGQSPEWLAANAEKAVALGSPGIDLNFGCPAKTVNKSKGGAVLLKDPELLYRIVCAVRTAVPDQPVTAKMRLGYDDDSLMLENAQAIAAAGADELTVHARTRRDGYKPPAYWESINTIWQTIDIPLIANGDIWSREDAIRCQQESGCSDIMIGRGALALPNLTQVIKGQQTPMEWTQIVSLLRHYSAFEIRGDKGHYYPNRIKQWLVYLKRSYPQATILFDQIRRMHQTDEIVDILNKSSH